MSLELANDGDEYHRLLTIPQPHWSLLSLPIPTKSTQIHGNPFEHLASAVAQ
jgi:hypothetical protein